MLSWPAVTGHWLAPADRIGAGKAAMIPLPPGDRMGSHQRAARVFAGAVPYPASPHQWLDQEVGLDSAGRAHYLRFRVAWERDVGDR